MEDEINERFPWMANIQGNFIEMLLGDSEMEILEYLQCKIAEEIEKLEHNFSFRKTKLLLKGVEYYHSSFCRMCSHENEDFSGFFTFSADMKHTWSYVFSSIIRISLLLSQGKIRSKWITHSLKEISRFPGKQQVLLDALLLVQHLNTKFKDTYSVILKNLFGDLTSFLPAVIDNPDEFLKMYLLVSRLRRRLKGAAEKVDLHCRVSRVRAPPSLWDWLLEHGFNVPWTRKGFRKVNLGMDICSMLGGQHRFQLKMVKELRKVLLPGLSTKRRAEILRPFADPSLAVSTFEKESKKKLEPVCSEKNLQTRHPVQKDNNGKLRKSKIKFKSNMLQKWNNTSQEDGEEGTSVSRPDMQKPTEADSDENVFCKINHTWAITTFDDKLDLEKKSKKSKSVQSEQRKLKLRKIGRKVLNEANQNINKDSGVLKDNRECKEGIVGRRNWSDMHHEDKEYCMGNNGYESEPKSKKRKQKVAEKNPDANVTFSDPEDISQTAEISKSKKRRLRRQKARQLDSSSKATEFIADKNDSDADDLPVIVEEICVNEPVSNERVTPKKENCDSNSSDDDQPVILKEVKHSPDSDLDSARRKESNNTKTEPKSNEIIAENYSPFSKLCPNIYSFMVKDAVEDNSRSRITDCSHTTEETQGVYTGSSSPFRSDQQEPISEKEIRTSLVNQTNFDLDGKLEGVDNVISSTTEAHSAQNDVKPLLDSVVQTESLDNCIKSDPISKKLVDRKEKTPIQIDFEMDTFRETKYSTETVSGFSLFGYTFAQEVEKHNDEHPSIKPISVKIEVDSETSHIDTETKENNAKVIQNSVLSCNVKREELTQEKQVSESSIDSPLANTSGLKTDDISPRNLISTVKSESVDISSPERMNVEINNNCSIKVKSEPLESLSSDSSLPYKTITEAVSDSSSRSSFKPDNPEVKKEREDTSTDMNRSSQNFTDDQPKYQVTGLFFDVKSPISKSKESLHKDSEGSPNHEMLNDIMVPKLEGKTKSNQVETPNTSAARNMTERALTLTEFAGCRKESIKQIFNKGDLTSTLNSISEKHSSELTSSTSCSQSNGKVVSTQMMPINVGNMNPVVDLGIRCDSKNIMDRFSNVSVDPISIPANSSVVPDIKAENEEVNKTKSTSTNEASLTVDQLLTPVNKTARKLDNTQQSILDAMKHEEVSIVDIVKKEIQPQYEDVKPCLNAVQTENPMADESSSPNEASLTVDQLLIPVNETARKLDNTQKLILDAMKYEEVSIVDIVKKEIQPHYEDIKPCLNAVQTENPMADDESPRRLNEGTTGTHCMVLRSRHSSSASSQGNFAPADEDSSVLNQDVLETNCMTLRSQNPSSPNGREQMASADEISNVLNQGGPVIRRRILRGRNCTMPSNEGSPATHCMNLRSRHSSSASCQGNSAFVDEVSNMRNQGAPVMRRMNLRARKSTVTSSQGMSAPSDEALSVVNQDTPATRRRNLGNKSPSTSSVQEVKKRKSQTISKRSSKRLKGEVNSNLGSHFSELSLNSPRALRSKPNDSTSKTSSEVVKEPSTSEQGNSCRRTTRASVRTGDSRLKKKDINPEGYNLRSRKSGKLNL